MRFPVLWCGMVLGGVLLTTGCAGEDGAADDDGSEQTTDGQARPYNLAGSWQFSGVDRHGEPRNFAVSMSGSGDRFSIAFEFPGVQGNATVSASAVTIVGDEVGMGYTMNGSITPDGRNIRGDWSYDDASNGGTFELARQSYDLGGSWSFDGVDRGGTPRSFSASFQPSGAGWSVEGVDGVTGTVHITGNAVDIVGSDGPLGYGMSGSLDATATRIEGDWSYDDGSNGGTFSYLR